MQHEQELAASGPRASDRYLRHKEVLQLVGVSWMSLRRWERQGRFPRRHKIGVRTVVWLESEINEWIANNRHRASSEQGAS